MKSGHMYVCPGQVSAKQALKKAALELKQVCEHVKSEYKACVQEHLNETEMAVEKRISASEPDSNCGSESMSE